VLRLRSSVDAERAPHFGAALRDLDGVKRVVQQTDDDGPACVIFVADVEPVAADRLVEAIGELGIAIDDYVLERIDVVAPERRHLAGKGDLGGFAWVEVMGQARANSRPLARYLALINVAAVIAALGVIKSSSILTAALKGVNLLPSSFSVGDSSLNGLAKTDYSTVMIALAAGVAAILSFETRASAAVGVAISVTTIPASAYLGVAIGAGGGGKGLGALVVLLINVSLLILSGSLTLIFQRWLASRSRAPA
jgi:Domain of unknown function (DUF389)